MGTTSVQASGIKNLNAQKDPETSTRPMLQMKLVFKQSWHTAPGHVLMACLPTSAWHNYTSP